MVTQHHRQFNTAPFVESKSEKASLSSRENTIDEDYSIPLRALQATGYSGAMRVDVLSKLFRKIFSNYKEKAIYSMKTARIFRIEAWLQVVLIGGLSLVCTGTALAQAPDNSRTNQQDRDKGSMTADQQAENQGDRDMAKKIRKSIADDKNLSTYAHNVKVIVRGGSVMLKGPVKTADEKSAIEAKAVEIAGAANVKNELTVKEK
jgi:hypothetical protein